MKLTTTWKKIIKNRPTAICGECGKSYLNYDEMIKAGCPRGCHK